MKKEQLDLIEDLIVKKSHVLTFEEIQALAAMALDCWINTRPRAIWNPVDPKLNNLNEFDEDWVLVAVKMDPEGWYGVPFVAELRDGVWYDRCDVDIERAYSVKITHWKPIENYEVGVYNL